MQSVLYIVWNVKFCRNHLKVSTFWLAYGRAILFMPHSQYCNLRQEKNNFYLLTIAITSYQSNFFNDCRINNNIRLPNCQGASRRISCYYLYDLWRRDVKILGELSSVEETFSLFFFKYANFMVSENFWNRGVTYNKQDLFTLFGRIWPKRN